MVRLMAGGGGAGDAVGNNCGVVSGEDCADCGSWGYL